MAWTESQQAGIRDFFNQNKNDEVAMRDAQAKFGVSNADLAQITGVNESSWNDYINKIGTYGGLGGDLPDWDQFNNQYMTRINGQSQGGAGATTGSTKPQMYSGGGGGGGGFSSGGGDFGASMSSSVGQNPYLREMGDALTQQATSNFNRNVLPAINSQAMATGGYGGSRQGVVQANATNDLNQGIANGLASLYGQGYAQDLNYDLGLRNNQLGFQNLGLNYANLDRNINNDNNQWQLQGAQFGLGLQDRLQQGNQAAINAGTNIQNTPMNYWSNFGNQYNSIGNGFGTTTGSVSQQGNPLMGALGGAQLGSRLGSMWGGSQNAAGGANAQGWGTGSGYGNQDLGSYF